jgi:hypothetical protein
VYQSSLGTIKELTSISNELKNTYLFS